jgi:hypothetical protein
MFIQLAQAFPQITNFPAPLIAFGLERLWAARLRGTAISGAGGTAPLAGTITSFSRVGTPITFQHLIYAYMLENTRIADIFGRVIYEYASGERLGIPRQATTYTWLRTTEELFYSNGWPVISSTIYSQIRPDPRAVRRNAYFRMFGMDLNHGMDDGRPYSFVKAGVANREFVEMFEAFLQETWRAIENRRNFVGANPTDTATISNLALRLQRMLNERRGGTATDPFLSREEFVAVAAMSWLHLIVDTNNPVVTDLQATAASPEERLRRIGERVGLGSHANSHSYFILAPRLSRLLIEIEAGLFSTPAGAQALFGNPPFGTNPIRDNVMVIIDHWSRSTGRNLKALPTSATRPSLTTAAVGTGQPVGNGRVAVAREALEV